jgi:fucose permease
MGIFLYVGAEVCVSSSTAMLLKDYYGIGASALTIAWALFFLPILFVRLLAPAVLKKISPKQFLFYTVLTAVLGVLCIFTHIKALAFVGTFLIGTGFANIFPLIFSITVDALPERNNELSGLMVTAIAGGAIVPPFMGMLSDKVGLIAGYTIPLLCLVYLFFVARANMKKAAN